MSYYLLDFCFRFPGKKILQIQQYGVVSHLYAYFELTSKFRLINFRRTFVSCRKWTTGRLDYLCVTKSSALRPIYIVAIKVLTLGGRNEKRTHFGKLREATNKQCFSMTSIKFLFEVLTILLKLRDTVFQK